MIRRLAILLVAALLGACDGGLYLTFVDDSPPSVSLAVGTTTAAPGQVLRLVAAASDDNFVAEVAFFRIDPNGDTFFLGSDDREPYEWSAVVPAAARGNVVRFFARATDSVGQQTDSAPVAVTVQ